PRQQHRHTFVIDRADERIRRRRQERVRVYFHVWPVLLHWAIVPAPDAGKRKQWAGSEPLSENQCHVAGFTSPLGSLKDDAGTKQRRSSNERFQNRLVRILSSRTLVTGRGARSFCTSIKPQLIVTISRSPSSAQRTNGAMWRGKIAPVGLNAA